MNISNVREQGFGAGSSLPAPILVFAGACTGLAVVVSAMSIHLQLKNYHKPILQRMVVRIMLMVPIYAVSSLVSLFSLEAAFVIDVLRDIYEAFVIYCFFHLLICYLGGERSLLILVHGRPPKTPVFPVNLFTRELDLSDPHTFLFLKRGILQYVWVKPVLAFATLFLKSIGKFDEGDFRANSGYLYVSIIYNTSICLSLYCLAMFWMCVNDDLKPFRPVPKFLCVKGILFFSFWQSIFVSILVAAGAIESFGPYTSPSKISLAVTDLLICAEMPLFAFFHLYAFAYTDYLSPHLSYVARMPMWHASKDAFGSKDVWEEAKATMRGEGMDYREFEPSEGFIHQGVGRDRRIRAGLRYSKGGKQKYWLPRRTEESRPLFGALDSEGGLLLPQDENVVRLAPDLRSAAPEAEDTIWDAPEEEENGYELPFGELDDPNLEVDEELYEHSRRYLFGDYNYPCIDVSTEYARRAMWDEEERVLRDERGAWFSVIRGAKGRDAVSRRDGPAWEGYGAVGTHEPLRRKEPRADEHVHPESRRGNDNRRARGKEVVIDYAQDQTPPAQQGDVLLGWTKTKKEDGRKKTASKPQSYSSPYARAGSSSVSGSPAPRSPPVLTPPSMSRQSSQGSPRAKAREDAVDLIVRDEHVVDKETSRERRKGEPAARGRASGLRRVYQESQSGREREEAGVQEERGRSGPGPRPDSPERAIVQSEERDGVIARAVTPPVYVQLGEDNPWA